MIETQINFVSQLHGTGMAFKLHQGGVDEVGKSSNLVHPQLHIPDMQKGFKLAPTDVSPRKKHTKTPEICGKTPKFRVTRLKFGPRISTGWGKNSANWFSKFSAPPHWSPGLHT